MKNEKKLLVNWYLYNEELAFDLLKMFVERAKYVNTLYFFQKRDKTLFKKWKKHLLKIIDKVAELRGSDKEPPIFDEKVNDKWNDDKLR